MNDKIFNGMFGQIEPGLCRLSMSGGIAVKTSGGYKSYDVKNNRLTNCTNFVFPNIGEEFFFVIPTNKAVVGDILLINRRPKCVQKVEKNMITVVNYEDGTVENVLPERHVFMGNTYFYGKIVSMFGSDLVKGKNGMNQIMKYMMISEMMKTPQRLGSNDGANRDAAFGGMSAMLPLLMMNGGMDNMFSGLFDIVEDEEIKDESEDNE